AVIGVADVAPAGQLIAFLTVLTAALTVSLSDDRPVAALRFADPPRREDEVDGAERILHAVRMVLDPACMKQKAGLFRAPPLRCLRQRAPGHARHFCSV